MISIMMRNNIENTLWIKERVLKSSELRFNLNIRIFFNIFFRSLSAKDKCIEITVSVSPNHTKKWTEKRVVFLVTVLP